MGKLTRNFLAGKMNKTLDERIVPNGEYIDALNIRMGSTDLDTVGVIENVKGNSALTSLYVYSTPLSSEARSIGAFADSTNETIYWFIHDSNFALGDNGLLDLIVSYNTNTNSHITHIISMDSGLGDGKTTLNFSPLHLITGVNKVDDFLIFTDGYNPPRYINVNKSYPVASPVTHIDPPLLAEMLMVIKRPPLQSPLVEVIKTAGKEIFLKERFICFAYRYKYENGEYSAISQFTAPTFVPEPFTLSLGSYLNEGMTNHGNAVIVNYNTGSELVKGIDLLFKEMSSNVIKVIEKINKLELGYADNVVKTYVFNNSKIYTILPDYELLRLYDNVPRLARSQTLMGNRLMYGCYTEGYNLLSLENGVLNPTKLTYFTELVSETIGLKSINNSKTSGNYSIDSHVAQQSVPDSVAVIDLTSVINTAGLKSGGSITIELTIKHKSFTSTAGVPTEVTNSINLSFTFYLYKNYSSAYDMVTNADNMFVNAIGNALNIKPVYSTITGALTSCDGTTFTDQVNCMIPNNLNSWVKFNSGITANGQAVNVIANAATPNVFSLQIPSMHFVDDPTNPTQHLYEYYAITNIISHFQTVAIPQSLHTNRGYEVAIIYQDDFLRSSTALVSRRNTEYIPCDKSVFKNSIRVIIPTDQIAPEWAKRYKFVVKQDRDNYETIYSNIAFKDPATNSVYFLLEGENARKVQVDDRLIVKSDSGGALKSCVLSTVLEKESRSYNFITIPNPLNSTISLPIPAGVYMKMNPHDFSIVQPVNAVVAYGNLYSARKFGDPPKVDYPLSIYNAANGIVEDYDIPIGSIINLKFEFKKNGDDYYYNILEGATSVSPDCPKRNYTFTKTFVASNNYANFKEWWDISNIASVLNNGISDTETGASVLNYYYPALGSSPVVAPHLTDNVFQFHRHPVTNGLMLLVQSGVTGCIGSHNPDDRVSKLYVDISVIRASGSFIFETEPTDAMPDIFYENDLSFEIGVNGEHLGNVQDQDFGTNTPAIIDTRFFNCYSFGNGAESFKVRDSVKGRTITLGNRVTSVAEEEYKESRRFADMTYSGVYNNETNVNKLNEFNMGLLNFKKLENSFGAICLMDARMTDILVLQEDKISYVLTGKNLLSDSVGGGSISSVPEVLGTQIARTEKYGCLHPESYVHWGVDRYFADAKRGVVIQLKGSESSSDDLKVISDSGMRTWFRNAFVDSINTQKLGGFDPYSNEYVLTINDEYVPIEQPCMPCGIRKTFNVSENTEACIEMSPEVGNVTMRYNVNEYSTSFEIKVVYNGDEYTTGLVSESGTLEFNKDSNIINTLQLSILTSKEISVEVFVPCAEAIPLTIVEIVITNNKDADKFIHNEYSYTGSPVQSDIVSFITGTNSPLISKYETISGYEGQGGFPVAGSVAKVATNKIGFDDFDFNPLNNKFKHFRSNTLYGNNQNDLSLLLSLCSTIPNEGGGSYNYSEFIVPSVGDYLYLIWDLRDAAEVELCYSDVNEDDACCNCEPCSELCKTYFIANATENAILQYKECGGSILELVLSRNSPLFVCVDPSVPVTVISGTATVTQAKDCGCYATEGYCNVFMVTIEEAQNISWVACNGAEGNQIFKEGIYEFTVLDGTFPVPASNMNISFIRKELI